MKQYHQQNNRQPTINSETVKKQLLVCSHTCNEAGALVSARIMWLTVGTNILTKY